MYNSSYFGQSGYSLPQYQQNIQQSPQMSYQGPTMLPGMVVNDISTVGPENVPMTGKPSVFPLNDGSAVYIKMWNPQGGISTVKYVPEATVKTADNISGYESLHVEIDMLSERIKNLEMQFAKPKEGM